MSTRRKVASIAFAGAAAVTAAGVNAAPAFASGGTWKVSAGGAPYSGSFSALNTTGPATLSTSTTTLTCPVSAAFASGSLHSVTSGHVGDINTASFGPCTLGGVIPFTAHLNHPAQLWAVGGSGAVINGSIRNVSATISGVGVSCHATVTGTLPGTYNNTTNTLAVNAGKAKTLTVQPGVRGCLGQIKSGQGAGFAANYTVLNPANLTITDP